jgi:hypothetical protein
VPYFMIAIYGEDNSGWEKNFEVSAPTAAEAVIAVLTKTEAIQKEVILHGIHIGAPYDESVSDEVVATWPANDRFERIVYRALV